MQSLSLHQNSGYQPAAMINRNQPVSVDKHDQIRDAVRAWAGVDGQDVVSALIIEEYQAQGGDEITFPDDLSRQRQKLFRFLDIRIPRCCMCHSTQSHSAISRRFLVNLKVG